MTGICKLFALRMVKNLLYILILGLTLANFFSWLPLTAGSQFVIYFVLIYTGINCFDNAVAAGFGVKRWW